jgi:hypothetical protein
MPDASNHGKYPRRRSNSAAQGPATPHSPRSSASSAACEQENATAHNAFATSSIYCHHELAIIAEHRGSAHKARGFNDRADVLGLLIVARLEPW